MAKNKTTIKISSDVKEAKSGIEQVTAQLNALTKVTKTSGFSKFITAFASFGTSLRFVKDAVKTTAAAINDLSETYKTQAKAETMLSTAAKNNPYLNGQSVSELKAFASELQSVTVYGDETTLPLMAQLASAGRTQSEITEIMTAAADVAAGGMMSLDSAVSALNKTYSGSVGQLGNQVSGLKDLTKEELKNGEAVKIVAEQYKGMAQEVARTTGSKEQLQNALGDLKEALGQPFETSMRPMRQFFTEATQKATALIQKLFNTRIERDKLNNAFSVSSGTMSEESATTSLEAVTNDLEKSKKDLADLTAAWNSARDKRGNMAKEQKKTFEALLKEYRVTGDTDEAAYDNLVEILKDAIDRDTEKAEELTARLKEFEDERKRIAEEQKQAAYEQTDDYKVEQIQKKYAESVDAARKEIAYRRQLGEEISAEEEEQQILNAMTDAYIKARQEAGDLMRDSHSWVTTTLSDIKTQTEKTFSAQDTAEQFAAFAPTPKDAREQIDESYTAQKEALDELYNSLGDRKLEFQEEYNDASERLEAERLNAIKALEEKAEKECEEKLWTSLQNSLSIVSDFISQYSDICSNVSDIITANAEAAATSQTLALEKQYAAGIVSAEEYAEKLEEIQKEQAQKEYEAQMWEWSASIAQATASTAQAVINALANSGNPTVGIAMASVIGAAGAAQLANIIANKPVAPSFSTGGIVGGSSYYGDRISANVNSGEMILTRAQQKTLFDNINKGSVGGNVSMPVTIKNYASNDVTAKTMQDDSGLKVFIQRTVASQLSKGEYNDSLSAANAGMNGTRYTS